MRKINYNEYVPENDLCHDRVRITNRNNRDKVIVGWKSIYDSKRFRFEYVKGKMDYEDDTLWYEDWIIEYL